MRIGTCLAMLPCRLRRLVFHLSTLSALFGSFAAVAQSQYTAVVDPHLVIVTNFEGWGTSLCWWANVVGGYSNRSNYAALAFSTLKLNIVRYNIGGGENPGISNTMEYRARMPAFEPSPGVWDWSADANQRWMLRQAVALGANRVVAFANSPPWWMTVSGSVTGSADGSSNNLQTNYESAFAAYLAAVVGTLAATDGIHFDYVTPINEPTAGWWQLGGRQEGCHTDPDQQSRLAADLRPALEARGISAGIDASEDNDEQSAVNSINAYGGGASNVSLIATHTYGANNPAGIRNLAASLRKPAWVSEYGDGDGSGMTMARRIHDDIAQAWVRAWVYWQVVDNAGGWGFLYNPLDGGGNTGYSINEKFYVMAQFSQFIRPGAQILNVNDNNSLAAYHPSNRRLVIVAVNDSADPLTVKYDLAAFSSLPALASAMRTSANENEAAVPASPVTNKVFEATLRPQSVTTFILNNAMMAPPSNDARAWYRLEGNALDASSNGNNGTASDIGFVPGKLGALAAQFNGSTSSIQIPRVVTDDFTIAFWVKTTDTGGTGQWWAGKGLVDGEVQGPAADFGVSLVGGKVGFGAGTPDVTVTTTNSINDGIWHHVAATRNSVTGEQRVYVDGILQASGLGPVGPLTAPPMLRIGGIQAGYAGGFFNGAIDDVQLFGRDFAPSEITGLMNHTPAFVNPPATSDLLAGRTLRVTNEVSDPDLPAQAVTWSLLSAPAAASINANSGIFLWRPEIALAPSTQTVTVQVRDNGTPQMSATQRFDIQLLRPQSPFLASTISESNEMSLEVNGDSGPDYILQSSTNLNPDSDWVSLFTNVAASPPFSWIFPKPVGSPQRFYRVVLGP